MEIVIYLLAQLQTLNRTTLSADENPKHHEDDRGNSDEDIGNGMRNVTALGLVSFFTDFSTEMVLGVLPLFIVSTLGASRALLGGI